jgi:hypothetical protein
MARRHRVVGCVFALAVLAWIGAELLTGGNAGLLYAAPALLLALPLAHGRYVAEGRLAGLAARSRGRRRAPLVLHAPCSRVQLMERGGRLVACAMAKRPPPAGGPLHSAAA